MIAGVVLAAGLSSRFGSEKLLEDLAGKPLFAHTIDNALASRLAHIHIVAGPEESELPRVLADRYRGDTRVTILNNDQPGRGQMSSLKLALSMLDNSYDAAMVILADMPLVTTHIIDSLAQKSSAGAIVVPVCDGRRRHPRVLPREIFAEVMELAGEERGTVVIDRHPDRVIEVDVGEPSDYLDVDHPDDMRSAAAVLAKRM